MSKSLLAISLLFVASCFEPQVWVHYSGDPDYYTLECPMSSMDCKEVAAKICWHYGKRAIITEWRGYAVAKVVCHD